MTMGDYRQGYADNRATAETPRREDRAERRRHEHSPEGFTYEFRDVDLTNGERGGGVARPMKRRRFCPAWIHDGDGIDDQGWKPFSMTTPVLLSLALLSLLVAAGIETLAQRSAARGGLALAPTQDDIPAAAMFAYQYVPNVAAAVYSLVWNWVDLDVKRMQPWFELSRPDGARGEDSLLLDYPVEFLAFVPLKAAKKRHWPVFLSGTIMMLVFWVITPLQSAILGTGVVHRTSPMTIVNRSTLLPLAEQADRIDPKALMIGYSMGWLNGTAPKFTTPEYALLPFYVDNDPAPNGSTRNWTATTTKLTAELDCWPAETSFRSRQLSVADFLNGQGCNASVILFDDEYRVQMQFIGYWGSAYSSYFLAGPDCPNTTDTVHQFLLLWTRSPQKPVPGRESNITALYCQSHYYKQDVRVTINSQTKLADPNSFQNLTERTVLTEKEFNATAFDYLVANGMDQGAEARERDEPYKIVVEQSPRLEHYNLTQFPDPAIGYALAGRNYSLNDLADPKALHLAFDRALKYLFSATVSRLLVNTTDFDDRSATSTYPLAGIIVSRPFSAAVEALLAACAILTFVLLWLCRKEPCHLRANPNSISRLNDIFRNSHEALNAFSRLDNADGKSLHEIFRNDRFRLTRAKGHEDYALRLEYAPANIGEVKEGKSSEPYYSPIRPFALTRTMGFIFLCIMVAALAVIIGLKSAESSRNGLARPSQSFEVLQLLENYIPTAFATLVEPFWVMLNRLICVMQPFQDLWAGKARPAKSIYTTYSAIPPQLTLWRALKARHFVLGLVCFTTLAANMLGVGLGALFNESPTAVRHSQEFKPLITYTFSNESMEQWDLKLLGPRAMSSQYLDHFTFSLAHLEYGTPLPPWVTPEYFFLPHSIPGNGANLSTDTYTLQTRGMGANFNCTPLPPLEINPYDPENKTSSCSDPHAWATWHMREQRLWNDVSNATVATTRCGVPSRSDIPRDCYGQFVMAWARSRNKDKTAGTIHATFAECRPVFETAMFNVTVDAQGNVLSFNRTEDIQSHLNFKNNQTLINRLVQTASSLVNCDVKWRNDSLATDWMSYLMADFIGNRDFITATNPPPDPAALIPTMHRVYRLTFSLLLGLGHTIVFDAAADDEPTSTGWRHTQETKIFLDTAPLIITLVVLSLNVVVAALFYARTTAFVLPRMPTSIGSILAYVAPSRAVASTSRAAPLRQSRTFSFGRYRGVDGLVHIGIELDPHVVPIDPNALRGDVGLGSRLWRRVARRKGRGGGLTTWL
ncbi:hypothetical protein JDV02_005041 [Purpureocillium takamizusanense]|uniref:Uncharacterized protein n=1 Tax=Purpureocillium takamizusanense TaxID=2060973 RepID=A0A9Q8QGH6_9HYPO|nr:uncharacterized protein JDV02_005041 [Purpureocillium takamizusanense]UNI18791.1 hypothetical protein JDV02_005041 [Purpureocillium takamizusanense]